MTYRDIENIVSYLNELETYFLWLSYGYSVKEILGQSHILNYEEIKENNERLGYVQHAIVNLKKMLEGKESAYVSPERVVEFLQFLYDKKTYEDRLLKHLINVVYSQKTLSLTN